MSDPVVRRVPEGFEKYEPPPERLGWPAWRGRLAQSRAPARQDDAALLEAYRVVDTLVAVASLVAVYLAANSPAVRHHMREFLLPRLSLDNVVLLIVFAILWSQLFALLGLYDPYRRDRRGGETLAILRASTTGSGVMLLFPIFGVSGFGLDIVPYAWLAVTVATLGARRAVRAAARTYPANGTRRVLIVGSGPRAYKAYRELCAAAPEDCELVGFVDSSDHVVHEEIREQLLGPLDELESLLVRHLIDEALIALPIRSQYAEIQRAIEVCERVGVRAKYLADVFRSSLARARYDHTGGVPVVTMSVTAEGGQLVVKRVLDIAGAMIGLVVLSPLFVATAIAIKATSPGPVLFVQERYGLRRRRFRMLKFRTMTQGAEALQPLLELQNEASGPVFKIQNDPRTTRLGRFLRRSSLDELPQLVNVLRGEMSLVGPRPLPERDVLRFADPWLMRRFSVPPGLTGLWQVSGRCTLKFDEAIALDLKYIDQWSLGLDLTILARTLPAVVKGTGAR